MKQRGFVPWLIRSYTRRRARRGLDGIYARGLAAARASLEQSPVIIASNHVCWWDPLVLVHLEQALGGEGFGLMRADSLRRLPFFKHTGALPLDLDNPRQAVRDLNAALDQLDSARKFLWIFPQGEQRPMHLRPLGFRPGVSWLAKKSGLPVIPAALHVAFAEQPVPRYLVDFAPPLPSDEVGQRDGHLVVERVVEERLAQLDEVDIADLAVLSGSGAKNPERGLGARLLGAGNG